MTPQVAFLINQSLQSLSSGNPKTAELYLNQALKLEPKNTHVLRFLGVSAAQQKEWEKSLDHFRKAVKVDPKNATAYSNMGNVFFELKKYSDAIQNYEKAVSLDPKDAEVWSNKGNALAALKKYDEAINHYEKALALNPQYAEAWSNKANLLSEQKKLKEALECCKHAIDLDNNYAPAWSNQASFLAELLDFHNAYSSADKALELDPSYAKAWLNKGSILNYLNDYTQAINCFDRAIELQPNYPDAWANKGVSLYELLQLPESIAACNKAIELDPNHVDGYWNKSFSELMLGNYEEGLVNYEARWQRKNTDPYLCPNIPALSSLENLYNKTILVWAEQGFGDTLQFARYIPKLIELGAKVTFEVQGALATLFQNQYDCTIISKGDPIGEVDLQTPLLSLPLLFKTKLESIPDNIPYLQLTSQKIQEWQQKLPLTKEKLNIGIACSGNLNFDIKHGNKRPVPLTYFSDLARTHNVFLIQKEIRDTDQAALQSLNGIHPLGDLIHSFEDTAAIVENMDLIISIDTSLAHLAGALGKKMIVLLPWCPDWRWLSTGTSNPWYPSATLIRQASPGKDRLAQETGNQLWGS